MEREHTEQEVIIIFQKPWEKYVKIKKIHLICFQSFFIELHKSLN